MSKLGRDAFVRYAVCPPGTPAGPDPDRAEMLLAEGLASGCRLHHLGGDASLIAGVLSERTRSSKIEDAAFDGASDVIYGERERSRVIDPDAYAAGAALAMGLEAE